MKRHFIGIILVAGFVALVAWWRKGPHTAAHPTPTSVAVDAGTKPESPATPPKPIPTAQAHDGGSAAQPGATGSAVVSGTWGSGPGQFGRKKAQESNPEAPMATQLLPDGSVLVLDQVNRRVQRWKGGKLVGNTELGGDTAQDFAAGKDGALVVLDRLADKNVQVYGSDGKLSNEITLVGKGVPEGGGVTGVFADDEGVYVEREHAVLVRVADASGKADPNRPELVGRPSRDGRLLLAAAIGDRAQGTVVVRAFDRKSTATPPTPQWTATAPLGASILHIVTVDSDRAGNVYVAATTGTESPNPPYDLVNEKLMVARISPAGQPNGLLALPPLHGSDESFRPVTVGDDGAVYVEMSSEQGFEVRRYVFP